LRQLDVFERLRDNESVFIGKQINLIVRNGANSIITLKKV